MHKSRTFVAHVDPSHQKRHRGTRHTDRKSHRRDQNRSRGDRFVELFDLYPSSGTNPKLHHRGKIRAQNFPHFFYIIFYFFWKIKSSSKLLFAKNFFRFLLLFFSTEIITTTTTTTTTTNASHTPKKKTDNMDEEDHLRENRFSSTKDYYGILGLPKDCTTDDVKRKYKSLAQKLHPDKLSSSGNLNGGGGHGTKDAAARSFALLHEAYECLQDEEKRRVYDVYGHEGVAGSESKEIMSMSKRKTREEMRREFEYHQR